MKLAAVFSDHGVLQRDRPIPVWGWAEPHEAVTVRLAGHEASTTAGADGAWRVTLPALPAGGPHELTVVGRETLTLTDLLVGEVWVCSGQSNMQWTVAACDVEAEITTANYPQIRFFTVPNIPAMEPKADIIANWTVCSPATTGNFSAVGYFFGRELHQALGVPIGLINTSWGGTVAEAWTSREALHAVPELRQFTDLLDEVLPGAEEGLAIHEEAMRAWDAATRRVDGENTGYPRGWADHGFASDDWGRMALPAYWQARGLHTNGVVWFRKEVEIPTAWAGRTLTLSLGKIDKADTTYFNNVRVGGISISEREDAWNIRRVYTVPGELVQAGRAVIAIRAFSHVWAGGVVGPAEEFYLAPEGEAGLPLAGEWLFALEEDFGDFSKPPVPPLGAANPNTPTVLYNGMIHPLIPCGMRGAIWYQGESNASRGYEYRTLFPTMIQDWRARWGEGDFPFFFVQLANYQAGQDAWPDSAWAELREAQTMTLALPNTGMAVIIDIGESTDIHPKNKWDVGKRLALNALAKTYGRDVEYAGPMYREVTTEGAALRVHFDHAAGLTSRETTLSGFAIAGADRVFYPASAVIDGATVLVSSPSVPAPVAVRYGWAEDPVCTLYNAAGLPASPFRTDTWARAALLPA